jgi:hypothetical protein
VSGFLSPFDVPAFASWVIVRPLRNWAFLTVGLPAQGRTSTGLSCCACTRHDRAGRLLYPGDGGAHPAGEYSPTGTRRFPTASPYGPATSSHRRGSPSRDINGGSRHSPITPATSPPPRPGSISPPVFSLPVTPGWNTGPWASSPSFAPHSYPRRTSRRRQAITHGPGYYTFDISRTSNGASHLNSCTFMPHVHPGGLHADPGDALLDQPVP